jgi:pyruvate kinase
VRPNDVIYLDDGKIICLITEIEEYGVKVEVKVGGELLSNKALKLVGGKHESLPVLHPQDYIDIAKHVKENSKSCLFNLSGWSYRFRLYFIAFCA